MKCPVDGELLVITERSGVELDYCPRCRGVWLDRGELDKIIEVAAVTAPEPAAAPLHMRDVRDSYREPRRDERRDDESRRRKKKRGGFADILEDLFDFD